MQKLEIYCNYGVLAAEKRKTVIVPDEWKLYKNTFGATMVESPWGECYEISEVLQGNEKPCFYALDREMKGHRAYLEEVNE